MNKLASLSVSSLRVTNHLKTSHNSVLTLAVIRFYSSENDSDDPKVKAKEKLNSLLQDLSVSGNMKSSAVEPKLAKPRPSKALKRSKDGLPKAQTPSTKELEQDVVSAAREVASLSSKKVKTESELLMRLKQVSKESNDAKKENEVSGEELESIFSGLRVDKPLSKQKQKVSRVLENVERQEKDLSMEQQAFLQKRAKMRREKSVEKMSETSVDLNSGIPLGIFDGPMSTSADSHLLQKWRACNQRELDILSTPPPRNALEEMIVQTRQGKLWQFPIDNEQGKYLHTFQNQVLLKISG